jgi:hypothetical protein
MQPQTLGTSLERPPALARSELDTRFPGKYLSLTSSNATGGAWRHPCGS